jgi:hypothetical protein
MAAPISAAPHSFSLMDNVSSSIGLMLFASHLRLGDRPDTKTRRAHVWLGYTTNGPPGGRRIQSRLETTGAIPDLIGVTAPAPRSWGPTGPPPGWTACELAYLIALICLLRNPPQHHTELSNTSDSHHCRLKTFHCRLVVFRVKQMVVTIKGHGDRAMPHDRLDSFRRPTKRLNKQTGCSVS